MNRFTMRRATAEDLPQLRMLWEAESLPGEALEKRLTEFQVTCSEQGEVVAAVGVQISGGQGRVHSEAIGWPDFAEQIRSCWWPRLETMGRNQGLSRLWTSLESPFWKGVGFKKVSEENRGALPAAFAEEGAAWLMLPLKSAETGADEIEKQFAVLKAMSQAENERLLERARLVKWIGMGLMSVIFAGFAIAVVLFLHRWTRRKK
jgi:hypothetical protein